MHMNFRVVETKWKHKYRKLTVIGTKRVKQAKVVMRNRQQEI